MIFLFNGGSFTPTIPVHRLFQWSKIKQSATSSSSSVTLRQTLTQQKTQATKFFLRGLLEPDELSVLKTAIEKDAAIQDQSYGRDDGAGRKTRVSLWNYPGDDVTGVVARAEKVAGTFEKVNVKSYERCEATPPRNVHVTSRISNSDRCQTFHSSDSA
jgi:hypothetical protein